MVKNCLNQSIIIAFRLKKVLDEISEAKTTASNYDLQISFSVLQFDF